MEDVSKIDYFLLSEKWAEPDVSGRICYSVRTSNDKVSHDKFVEETKRKLLKDNDDDYTSWRHTYTSYHNIGGIQPHCSVLHFRVRDAG